ncbi:MAG: PKD domain-containing protein [Bacteroidales bacterium]
MKKLLFTLTLFLTAWVSANSQVISSDACQADFQWKVNDQIMMFAPGMAINFYDLSRGEEVSWHWDFGDGSWSEEQNPMHIFTFLNGTNSSGDSGYYVPRVCLTIKTKAGCTSTVCKFIKPIYDTLVPPTPGCDVFFYPFRNDSGVSIPEVIPYSFKVSAPQNTVSWFWDFGDGATSVEANPTHGYYFLGGEYNVCLTIATDSGCSASYCTSVYIDNQDSTITPDCQASYTYTVMESYPEQFAFTDLSYGTPSYWFWDFGDGTYSTEQNPVHIFDKRLDSLYHNGYLGPPLKSHYKVCLTVSDGENCKSSFCDYVYLGGGTDTIYPQPCPYLISVTTSNILGGSYCTGTASASLVDTEGNPVDAAGFYWSTGETGSSASGLCVNIPYYVSITSSAGCQLVGSFALIDYTKPMEPFGYWSIYGNNGWYDLNYTKPDSGYVCQWEFSDGTTVIGDKVNYSFDSGAEKSVILTVMDQEGNMVYTESIDLDDATGIPEKTKQQISLYPNPATEIINLRLDRQPLGEIEIGIFNTLGQQVSQKQISNPSSIITVPVGKLAHGMYYVRIVEQGYNPFSVSFIK